MQGLLDRPPRAALPRGASPEIRFAKTDTVTVLGGGGAFIYIVVSEGRPLKYTDPDGKFTIPWPLVVTLVKEVIIPAIGAYLTVKAINETAEYTASIVSKPSVVVAQAPEIPDNDKDKIAEHSWESGHGGEHDLDIPTVEGIRETIDNVLNNPKTVVKEGKDKATGNPKYGYFSPDGTVVIHNPAAPDKGTIYKPDNSCYAGLT